MKQDPSTFLRFGKATLALAAALCLAGVAHAEAPERTFGDMLDKIALVPAGPQDSEMLAKVGEAVGHIKRMALPQAQLAVNAALQLDPRNAYLHFLNAFVYHLQARQGDTQKTEMAIEGYQQALRIDPGHWIAQEFLGLAYMDLKQFDRAKLAFSSVLLLNPDSRVSVSGLMVAAYLTGDASTACAMADQFQKAPEAPPRGFVRSSIAVYASCGDFDHADRMRQTLAGFDHSAPEVERVDRRLAQWKAFYREHAQVGSLAARPAELAARPDEPAAPATITAALQPVRLAATASDAPALQVAQAFTVPSVVKRPAAPAPPAPAADGAATPAAAPSAAPRPDAANEGPRMLLIDVVLLSMQETVSTSKGVNLLSALTLQLGSFGGNLAAFSRVTSANSAGDTAASVSTAITRAVTIPALAYSLNIANANSSVNEVLARPTLAAIEGLPSEFFSGTNLSAGVVSTSTQGGTTVVPLDKRFGIKLAVTPSFVSQGRVQLKVEAQRTALNATAENARVAYQIEIGETTANANVVMNVGDTLVLSGLSEKSSTSTRDGVPGLQEVPGLQYLVSSNKANSIQRSVLILVTPRSAVQVAEAPADAQDTMAGRMKTLRARFGLPARVPANIEAILSQSDANQLFREFRQGDVAMERWDRMRSTGDRLREALGFLYF